MVAERLPDKVAGIISKPVFVGFFRAQQRIGRIKQQLVVVTELHRIAGRRMC